MLWTWDVSRSVFLALLIVIVEGLSLEVKGQDLFNKHAVHPDVWRPAARLQPGVDSGGNLNLSIPIVTVPGRGGLDYPISLSYRSGIKAEQQSSWVGLGWSFDPGSITRDVQSEYDVVNDVAVVHGADFAQDASQLESQPDMYYVSLPGFSGSMSMYDIEPNNPPPHSSGSEFYFTDWSPWLIEPFSSGSVALDGASISHLPDETGFGYSYGGALTSMDDYHQWVLTDPSGTRYVFGKPTYATNRVQLAGGDDAIDRTDYYINTWRLLAILGANYVADKNGGDLVPCSTGPGPITEPGNCREYGNWVKFYYEDTQTFWKSNDSFHSFSHTTIKYVETPTHLAEFTQSSIGATNCGLVQGCGHIKKLESVSLFAKNSNPTDRVNPGQRIKKVSLASTENGHASLGGLVSNRLRLDGIHFYGTNDNDVLPGYAFTYYDNTSTCNPIVLDLFGYCFNGDPVNVASKVWSLETILYPSGELDKIHYEDDFVDLSQPHSLTVRNHSQVNTVECLSGPFSFLDAGHGDDLPGGATGNNQGGGRVKKIDSEGIYNGGVRRTTEYEYGKGRSTGIPAYYFKEYGYENDPAFFVPNGRGQARVVYTFVKSKNIDDGTYVETHYTTDDMSSSSEIPRTIQTHIYRHSSGSLLIRGNDDLNWGLPYKTISDGKVVKTIARQYDLTTNDLAEAYEYGVDECDQQLFIRWYNKGKVGQVTRHDEYEDSGQSLIPTNTTEYKVNNTYNSKNLVTETLHTISNAYNYRETYEYQYQHNYGSNSGESLTDRNILNALYRTDVISEEGKYLSSSVDVWRKCDSAASYCQGAQEHPLDQPWVSEASYTYYASSNPSQAPYFNPQNVSSSWVRARKVAQYDGHGNPKKIEDAYGSTTYFSYPEHLDFAQLGSVWSTDRVSNRQLRMDLSYDGWRRLIRVDEPNGVYHQFGYDTHSRLTESKLKDTKMSDYQYQAAREGGSGENWILSKSYQNGSSGPGHTYQTKQYLNGSGTVVQTSSSRENGKWTIQAQKVDGRDKPMEVYKPFTKDNSNRLSSPNVDAENAYGGVGVVAWTAYNYSQSFLDQVNSPATSSSNVQHVNQDLYVGRPPGSNVDHAVSETTDEHGNVTKSFTNARGQTVYSERSTPSGTFKSGYVYDRAGNLVEVRPPNYYQNSNNSAWVTSYAYDSWGQVKEKSTPDLDDVYRYKFDKQGNLRVILDPNNEDAGSGTRLYYNKYDSFNRLVEEGTIPASDFGSFDINDPNWPSYGVADVSYVYDKYIGTIPPGIVAEHAKGKLIRVHKAGAHTTNYYYDELGRLALQYNDIAELEETKKIAYDYYVDGTLDRLTFQPDDSEERVSYDYSYDAAGRLAQVSSEVNGSDPQIEAYYGYEKRGLLDVAWLGDYSFDEPVQHVDFTYHIRDWLTEINNINNPGQDHFAMKLGYDTSAGTGNAAQFNGNIAWMEWKSPSNKDTTNPSFYDGAYRFSYDGLNRLTAADNPTGSGYDLSNITYDHNGNITGLTRNNATGSGGSSPYGVFNNTYVSGTNRLSTHNNGTQPYSYDKNGNVLTDWKDRDYTYTRYNQPSQITKPLDTNGGLLTADYVYSADNLRTHSRETSVMGGTTSIKNNHYIRGIDGAVIALYEDGELKHWNILAGGSVIGRIEPAASN